jgi:phosphoribosyl-AMP cyclohydrolase
MDTLNLDAFIKKVTWNDQGLVPVIAQDVTSKEILMMAWMNEETLRETMTLGQAIYWSRSRGRRWHKGEESGHFQNIKAIRIDCDGDAILIIVEQVGGIACHTGAPNCFFQELRIEGGQTQWVNLKDSQS